MIRFFRELKVSYLIFAIMCLGLGISLLIWPDISAKVLCIGLGTILAIAGGVNVIVFAVTHDGTLYSRFSLIVGVIFLAIGGFIIWKPEVIMAIIPIIMGIFIIIHGFYDFKQTLDLGKFKYEKWYVALIVSILTMALGVLIIVNPFETASTLMIFVGIALVFDGLSDIWIISRVFGLTHRMKRELKKQLEETEILTDSEPVEVPENK